MDIKIANTKFGCLVGIAFVDVVAPALLLLGAGNAQALPDVAERGAPRDCGSCGMFDPQPEPPGFTDPGSRIGLGGPDTLPPVRGFNTRPWGRSAKHTYGAGRIEYVQPLPIPSRPVRIAQPSF
jgi:hypothetical protein